MFDEYIERPSIPIRWAGLFSLQPYFLRFDRPVAVSPGVPTTCVPLHYDRQRGPADLGSMRVRFFRLRPVRRRSTARVKRAKR